MSNEGLELEVYGYKDPKKQIGTIRNARDPQVLEEVGNVGGGSFQVNSSDKQIVDNPTWLKNRNVIKHRVNGKVIGAWLIGHRQAITISENASQAGYEIGGEGLKSWFDDARVDPMGGLKESTRDNRSFSWASEEGDWYNASDWINPYQISRVFDKKWQFGPTKWPEGATGAYWVWGTPNSNPGPAAAGHNLFRIKVPVATAGEYSLYVAVDDNYSVYLDGEEVATYDELIDGWKEAKKINLELEAGTHTIGIRATNYRGAAGMIAALFRKKPRVAPSAVGTVVIPIGTTPTLTSNGHGLTSGTRVYLTTTGTLPGGLEPNKTYYVTQPTTNTFKIAKSAGGPSINTSGSQSGTHTIHRAEVAEVETLVTYSGMSVSTLTSQLTAANSTVTIRQNTYNNLPAGNPKGNNTQKKQAKAKATALANLKTAQQARDSIQKQLDAANAANAAGITWKVMPYPAKVPGWTPGGILLKLLQEAAARGVRMASLLTPNFTALVDSEGEAWSEPIDWTFAVGESLASVVSKLEEVACDVWIDPDTYQLNVVNKRGTDRSQYRYDTDGITVLETPVIFRAGKNLRKASIQSRGKIKNSLSLKTEVGWQKTPEVDATSLEEYGALEATLDTGTTLPVSKSLAKVIFQQRAQEEEGASYDVFLPPEGKTPHVDFKVGDWVLAPDEQGLSVKRRIMSISTEVDGSGNPMYTIEFDTIFRDNEDRINRVLEKLGGNGVGSSYTNAGGVGQISPSRPELLPPPDYIPVQTIPEAPTDLEAFSIGYWSSNGVKAYSQVTLTWTPVMENTDGTEVIPLYYEVWARSLDASDDADILMATVTQPIAVMDNFEPGTNWEFSVLAWNEQRASAASDTLAHQVEGPLEPLPAPTAPTGYSDKGVLFLEWDGLLSNGSPPDPQFRYIYAEFRKVGDPGFTLLGQTLGRDGRQMVITPMLPNGTQIEARFYAKDGANISSLPSATSAPITIQGVDLGDLDQQVRDAIQAAKDAGDAAAAIADSAQTAADIAKGLANQAIQDSATALSTAENAMSTANGMITWSPEEPVVADGDDKPVDATWYRTSANGIIGQWRWNGTAWTTSPIDSDAIYSINAVKITAGTLDAARIAANSITGAKILAATITGDKIAAGTIGTSKLLVTNLNNMVEDNGFEYSNVSGVSWTLASGAVIDTVSPRSGTRALKITTTTGQWVAATQVAAFNVEENQQYRLEAWVRLDSGEVVNAGVTLRMTYGSTEASTPTVTADIVLTPEETSTAYTLLSGVWKVPAGAKWARLQIISRDTVAGKVYRVDDVGIFRMSDGTLIVDGSIDADKVAAESITGQHIQAGSIATPHLQAQAVTSEEIAAEAITAEKIAVGAIETDHISAGSIKVAHISSEVGQELNIQNNSSINLIVGEDGALDQIRGTIGDTNDELERMQTYYQFGPAGAVISKPGSVFATRIDNDSIDMLENGNVISYWNSGTLYVNQMVGESVTLGNHQLAKFEGGTVVRYIP